MNFSREFQNNVKYFCMKFSGIYEDSGQFLETKKAYHGLLKTHNLILSISEGSVSVIQNSGMFVLG